MKSKTQKGYEIVFGVNSVLEVLRAGRRFLMTLYTTKERARSLDNIIRKLSKNAQLQYVSRNILDKIAGTSDHQGVVAYVGQFPARSKLFEPKKQPFLLLLDGIQDPRNLGAIIRSAYCIGVNGIIIPQKGSSPLTGTAFKASAGLAEHMEIYYAKNSISAVLDLKKQGYNIYLAAFGGRDATKVQYKKPLCLVIGSEGKGISPELLKQGEIITLPQVESKISYNASVAAGILMFLINHK